MNILILVMCLLIASAAHAGGNKNNSLDQLQEQTQLQGQVAKGGKGVGHGGDATSRAASTSESDSTAIATGGTGGNAVNEGVSYSPTTSYNTKTRALALSLPGATADNGSTAPCLESKRGVTILGIGWSGRTSINTDCFAAEEAQRSFNQCLLIADAYARMGRDDLVLDQLQKCGGLTAVSPGPDYVTREEMAEREQRMLEQAVQK